MNNLQALTLDSREVAKMLPKRHSDLLRDIATYSKYLSDFNERNFALVDFFQESSYQDSKGEIRKCYLITKKGCEFIAHKMTGRKGALFTATYINRFHEMEELLKKRENNKEYMAKIIDRFFLPELNPANNQELMVIKIKQLNELRGLLPYIKDLDKRNVLAEYLTRELIRIDLWDAYKMTDPTDWSINTPEGANKWGVLISSLNLISNNRPVTREELRKLAQEIREICEEAEKKLPPKRLLPRQARGKQV